MTSTDDYSLPRHTSHVNLILILEDHLILIVREYFHRIVVEHDSEFVQIWMPFKRSHHTFFPFKLNQLYLFA